MFSYWRKTHLGLSFFLMETCHLLLRLLLFFNNYYQILFSWALSRSNRERKREKAKKRRMREEENGNKKEKRGKKIKDKKILKRDRKGKESQKGQ